MGHKDLQKALWFRKDDEEGRWKTIAEHIEDMQREGLETVILYRAFRDFDLFYCPKLDTVAERHAGLCGKVCDHYKPRNGKSGMCNHTKPAYTGYPKTYYRLTKDGLFFGPVKA